jgi:hypothetical protein
VRLAMKIYILDRFEGGFAVLENEQGKMSNVPLQDLPAGLREGDVLCEDSGVFTYDEKSTKDRAEKIKRLIADLFE